ncbi:MAG: hypothetical protein IPL67_17405 [Ignavibacteria bacterium]|nr:hypothetical protein [Ignavibacteria bacterium]
MFLLYFVVIAILVLLLYDYRSGIITSLMVITNFGEFVYVNPNLEIGDFGGIGTIYFMDLFWIALLISIFIRRDRFQLLNYKASIVFLISLFVVALIIPFLISSFSAKDMISVIRPLGNFLFLPYLVFTITGIKELNFFEKVITTMVFAFLAIQVYEYVLQKRIPIRFFDEYSLFYGEDPFAVEFGGIKTGYIWSRIGYLLPFNLFFGAYYYFTDKRNYGMILIGAYMLSIMITLSRIWIIGFVFFLIIITIVLMLRRRQLDNVSFKLFLMLGSFAIITLVLLFSSTSFGKILDIFLLRINSINDLADKTDSSFLGREYILLRMISVWFEYPVFGAGFSGISRKLVTNDLGIPNLVTIFGGAGILMLGMFFKQYYGNIKPFIANNFILFTCLLTVMMMITFMSIFSIDMFYYNAIGAMLFAFGNIMLNIAKQDAQDDQTYREAA